MDDILANSDECPCCLECGKPLAEPDRDRSTCTECRSRKDKVSDLDIAIRASGDIPGRVPEWRDIRRYLRRLFGYTLSDAELWECCTDWLQLDHNLSPEEYLRVPIGELLGLLEEAANAAQAPQAQVVVTEFREAPEPLAGRSRPEIYEHLLCEFRREHTVRSKSSIILQLFDEKMFQLEQELRPKEILYCGSTVLEQKLTPIGEKWNPWCDTFRVVCIPYPFIALSDSERAQYDTDPVSAWEKFSTLATQAGAHLSVGIRKTMLSCEGQPLANWLQLMFCTLRPKIELERAYGNRCNLSHMPFADAADVIELCRLNTNEPILPPLLQERKGRIDAIPEAPVLSKGEETKNSTKKVRKRGRRSDTDHDEDKKIFDAWKTGRHKTYGALAKDRGKNEKGKNIALAIDRHRHRTNRGNAS